MEQEQYLGIDIGGTAVKLGLVDSGGHVLEKIEASVSFDGYQTPILDTVIKTARTFLAQTNVAPSLLHGIGVSATGQIDSRQGIVVGTGGNIPGWDGAQVAPALREAFRLPVTVANDANCMCLGEAWVGAAAGCTDVIGITVGTGLGGGILSGGRLLEGFRGLGGELGHLQIHALDGIPCPCGQRGCWEMYGATTALVTRAKALSPALSDGRAIFAAAEAGNGNVLALLDGWLDELAVGLIGLIHVFNPQMILIGGGVSGQQALMIDPLRKKVLAGIMPAFAEGLTLKAASLKNDAGMVGAVSYFIAHQN